MKEQSPLRSRGTAGFAAGFLVAVFLFLALLWAEYQNRYIAIENQRSTGLASVSGFDNPIAMWNSTNLLDVLFQASPGQPMLMAAQMPPPEDENRKIIKNGALQIQAADPAAAAEQIQQITKRVGGEVLKSALNNSFSDKPEISMQIGVPASRFDEARAAIGNIGSRLDAEQIQARDVGKEYVDLNATLRNEEAKESQYLALLKRAATIHDMLEVSQQLDQVRGNIEKTRGELQFMTRQIEISMLDITIVGENRLGPLELHPLYRLRMAWRNTLTSLVDFISGMAMLLSYLPAALLWIASVFVLLALGWRLIRRLWKIVGFSRQTAA
jgi:hypothetical protein